MKIGYFTSIYPRAVDTFIHREVTGLRARGFEVFTYSIRKADDSHNVSDLVVAEKVSTFYLLPVNLISLAYFNFKFLAFGTRRYWNTIRLAATTRRPGLSGALYQFFYFLEGIVLAHRMEKDGIQHVHNHLGDNSGNVILFASMLTGISYSITFHGPHVFFEPKGWALREKVKYSKFIVCIGKFCRSQLMLFSDPVDWERFQIVHCGVDPDKHKIGIDEVVSQGNRLIYVGRLAVEKGLPILFEAIRKLDEKGHKVYLTLVGDGPDRKYLEEQGVALGIEERLDFVGYAGEAEVIEYLRKSDIFVLPSFAEGVPGSIMEAMACGVPVIGTYVGGVAELIENEKTGLIVFPSDCGGLAEAIEKYLCDETLRESIIRNAREKIMIDHNNNIELDKLAALFRQ